MVHEHHGVGRFVGIQRMPVDGVEKDYIKIDYAGGDCLYVPVTQLDLVSKYIGGGEDTERTKLNKLGGARVDPAENQGQEGRQGSGQGAHRAVRRAAEAAGLRLLPGLPLAAGV